MESEANQTLARALDAVSPHLKQLDPLLLQALQAPNLTQASPDLSRHFLLTWGIVFDVGVYVPPPIRPVSAAAAAAAAAVANYCMDVRELSSTDKSFQRKRSGALH